MGSDFSAVEIGARYEQTRLLLVGEASGEAEAREGFPFRPYAQSGSLLSDALRQVAISRAEVAITNIIRCRPKNDWFEGSPFQYAATNQCIREHLIPAISNLRPRAILALGGTAFRALTSAPKGRYGTLELIRGYTLRGAGAAEGVPVIGTFHPAFLRRGMAHLTPLLQRDLRRAFLIATGKAPIVYDPPNDLCYQTSPTIEEAWAYAEKVDPELPLIFDIETPMSTRSDEDERTSFTDRDIKLFQCTQQRGAGIALPFRDEYVEVIRSILRNSSTQVGFNNWNFDDTVLQANGIDVGQTDDAMVMFGCWQPDLPKNLQAAAQFCGFQWPWKHLNDSDLEFYGCADVDATLTVYETVKAALNGRGESYKRYFADVWPILRDMSARGVPIDEQRRGELKALIEQEDIRITAAVQALVPPEVLSTKQKGGLKRTPKDTTGMVEIEIVTEKEEKCQCLRRTKTAANPEDVGAGWAVAHLEEYAKTERELTWIYWAKESCPVCTGTGIVPAGTVVRRWAEPVEFNPNSSHQVKRFMKFMKHPIPKHSKRTDAQGEASETTEVKELERLFAKTKHPIYPLLIEKRQLTKVLGTYVEGWAPGKDGRVRTTFTFQTATWQTSCCEGNTPITTKRGIVPIREVRVGDKVWTHRKRWRLVTARWLYPSQPMVEVHFGNGHVLTCTILHRLLFLAHGAKEGMAHPREHRSGIDSVSRSALLQQAGDRAAAKYNSSHNRLDHAAQDVSGRTSRAKGSALLKVKGWGQESYEGKDWTHASQLEGSSGRWVRILDVLEGWQAPVCASSSDGRGVRTENIAQEIRRSSHRSGQEEQRIGQSGIDDACGASNDSCDSGYEYGGIRITKIIPVGSFPIHDITVDEDESYESCGVFSHNSRSPNIQNGIKHSSSPFQKQLAEGFNRMIAADSGRVFVNFDFKSFHALTTAFQAESKAYERLARLDVHSFLAAHALKLPEAGGLYARDDHELADLFKFWKKDEKFKHYRDFKAKRCVLGIQFGMGYRKLYQMYKEDYASESEAKMLWNLFMYDLFPDIRQWQDRIRQQAHEDKKLVSLFGAVRWFHDVRHWDARQQKEVNGEQAEQAVAFLPANHAFGMVRDCMLRLRERGLDERYGLFNSIHDSLLFHCEEALVEECVSVVREEMQRPSTVLIGKIAPLGLSVGVDVAIGQSLAEMRDYSPQPQHLALDTIPHTMLHSST